MHENQSKGPATRVQTTYLPDLLTVEDVATYLHAPTSHVYRAAGSGKLRHYKVGKRLLFTEAHVAAYIAGAEVEPPARAGRPRRFA